MDTHANLETDLFRSYWDDGLLDILCGLGLLAIGLGWERHLVVVAATVPLLLASLWGPLRRWLVVPRAGFVRFSRSRRRQTTQSLWLTLALGSAILVALLVVFVILQGRTWPALDRSIAGLPAVLLAPGALFAGLLTGARRFYNYGFALVAAAALVIALSAGPAWPFLTVGPLIAGVGAILLAHFLSSADRHLREHS